MHVWLQELVPSHWVHGFIFCWHFGCDSRYFSSSFSKGFGHCKAVLSVHRIIITERFRVERTFKVIQFQPPATGGCWIWPWGILALRVVLGGCMALVLVPGMEIPSFTLDLCLFVVPLATGTNDSTGCHHQ